MDNWDQHIRQKVKQARPFQPKKDWGRMEQLLDQDERKGLVPTVMLWWPYAAAASIVLLALLGWWSISPQSSEEQTQWVDHTPSIVAPQSVDSALLPQPILDGAGTTLQADRAGAESNEEQVGQATYPADKPTGETYPSLEAMDRNPTTHQAGHASTRPQLIANAPSGNTADQASTDQQRAEVVRQHVPDVTDVPLALRGPLQSIGARQYQLVRATASYQVDIRDHTSNWWDKLAVSFPPLPEGKPQKGWAMEVYAGTQSSVSSNTSLSAFEFGTSDDLQTDPINPPDPAANTGALTVDLLQRSGTAPVPTQAIWGPSIGVSVLRDFSPQLSAGLNLNWNRTLAPIGENMFGTALMDGQYLNLNWNTQYRVRKRTTSRIQPYLTGGLGFALTESDITFAQLGQSSFVHSSSGSFRQTYNSFLATNELVDASAVGSDYVVNATESYVVLTEANKYVFYASGTVGLGTQVRLSTRLNFKLGADFIFNSPLGQTGMTEIVSDPLRMLFRATGGLQLAL